MTDEAGAFHAELLTSEIPALVRDLLDMHDGCDGRCDQCIEDSWDGTSHHVYWPCDTWMTIVRHYGWRDPSASA